MSLRTSPDLSRRLRDAKADQVGAWLVYVDGETDPSALVHPWEARGPWAKAWDLGDLVLELSIKHSWTIHCDDFGRIVATAQRRFRGVVIASAAGSMPSGSCCST